MSCTETNKIAEICSRSHYHISEAVPSSFQHHVRGAGDESGLYRGSCSEKVGYKTCTDSNIK